MNEGMTSDSWISRILRLEPGVSTETLQRIAARADDLPSELIEQHLGRIRNRARYLRDFEPAQIVGHLRLLSELGQQALVTVAARDGDDAETIVIDVCGVDVRGASAVVTGCLAEMGLSIVQLEVLTWDDPIADDDSPPAAAPAPLSGRYIIVLRAVNDQRHMAASAVQPQLLQRLKAAYWHLVRGDIQKARQETSAGDALIQQIIDSRFRVESLLGDGGLGRIYLATQMELNRPVALKVLRRDLTSDPVYAANFQRESRLMAQARSTDVVQVYAAGMHDGQGWIAMEYLSGGDLAHWISRHGTPAMSRAARWMEQALSGLEYIHSSVGIVHCDLKPANFLLDAGQNLKIGDLGLSQLQHLTRLVGSDGKISGTLWYMSPEQAQGQQPDERSDLFSLGASFYHILSGRPPFDAATSAEILAKVLRVDCPPLSEAAPHLPAGLAVLVERMMQPDPLRRYQDAGVAKADLESYLGRQRIADLPPGGVFAPGSGSGSHPRSGTPTPFAHANQPTEAHVPV